MEMGASSEVPVAHNTELFFSENHIQELQRFHGTLEAGATEAEKFQRCIDMRDDLLQQQTRLNIVITSFEAVMHNESKHYQEHKREIKANRSDIRSTSLSLPESDAISWDRFIGVAQEGLTVCLKCMPSLRKVSGFWSKARLQHYGFAYAGEKYCKVIGTAASEVPDWDEASIKLNMLMLRRITIGGRRQIRHSANPIDLIDLQNLKRWQTKGPYTKINDPERFCLSFKRLQLADVPDGYGFDQHGLLVRQDFAAVTKASSIASPVSPHDENLEHDYLDVSPTSAEIQSENLRVAFPDERLQYVCLSDIQQPAGAVSSPLDERDVLCPQAASSNTPKTRHLSASVAPASNVTGSPLDEASDSSASSEWLPEAHVSSLLHLVTQCCVVPGNTGGSLTIISTDPDEPRFHIPFQNPWKGGTVLSQGMLLTETPPRVQELHKQTSLEDHSSLYDDDENEIYGRATLSINAAPGVTQSSSVISYSRSSSSAASPTDSSITSPSAGCPNPSATQSNYSSRSNKRMRLEAPELLLCRDGSMHDVVHSSNGIGHQDLSQPNAANDAIFFDEVVSQLRFRVGFTSCNASRGQNTDKAMLDLLERACQPETNFTSSNSTDIEVYYLDPTDASMLVESQAPLYQPIVIPDQQQIKWHGSGRPLYQLLNRLSNLESTLPVQKIFLNQDTPSLRQESLVDIQARFYDDSEKEDRWNVLEMPSPLSPAIPSFLTGENCGLLLCTRGMERDPKITRHNYISSRDHNSTHATEQWVSIADSGAQTLPRQDSCGFATWITAQEGAVGIGWLSKPVRADVADWRANSDNFDGGHIRYLVLHPGQTIFLPVGTMYFVFRNFRHGTTLMLGGRVLQWSQLARWIQVVEDHMASRFGDDMMIRAAIMQAVRDVKELVLERQRYGRLGELVSEEAIRDFFSNRLVIGL